MRKNRKDDIVESESEKIARVEKAEVSNFSTVSKKPGWNRKPAPTPKQEETEVVEAEEPEVHERSKSPLISGKKIGIIVGAVVAIVAIVVVALLVFGKSKDEKLAATLEEMGRDWYENFYYDGFEEKKRADILSRFKDIGIKVDIDNLSRYNTEVNSEKLKDFKMDEEGGCDKTETKVIIKPQDPYGKSDYNIETKLVCGDKKEENTENQ